MVLNQSHFLYYWRYVKDKDRSLGIVLEWK